MSCQKIATWVISLENTDSRLHRNSKEYEKMKSAVLALDDYRNNQNLSALQIIGKYPEEIQAASMKYVKAKEVAEKTERYIESYLEWDDSYDDSCKEHEW